MAISIILAHPNPGSFNHAIAQTAARTLREMGRDVILHDLYAERFDPSMTATELNKDAALDPIIGQHCRQITSADGIVIVHPNWWAQPPAILKGWLDRVLRQGVAYTFGTNDKGEFGPIGLLKAAAAVVFNTSNTPADLEVKLYSDPLENLWRTCVFGFCGIRRFSRRLYSVVITSTPQQRAAWLADVERTVRDVFGAAPSR